jgi:3-dehydroquinate dehydratase-1
VKVGTVELGKRPAVILVPDWSSLPSELERARELRLDLIEARVDLMEADRIRENLDLIADYGFYSVLTVRPTWEGGKFRGGEEERLELFKELIPHPAVGAVDVELNSKILPEVRKLARAEGKRLIVSYHDFEKTPEREEIKGIFEKAVEAGADVVKTAFMGSSNADAARVCSVMAELPHPKVFMVMGEVGKFTRIVGFSFGSLLTYTFFGRPVAPGQIEAERLVELLAYFYPEYRREREKFLRGALL